jgi:cob(I)alamin adenosyltransferase
MIYVFRLKDMSSETPERMTAIMKCNTSTAAAGHMSRNVTRVYLPPVVQRVRSNLAKPITKFVNRLSQGRLARGGLLR